MQNFLQYRGKYYVCGTGRPVSYTHLDVYKRQIFNSLRKLDVLQELVDDRDVTEIMVNGPNAVSYTHLDVYKRQIQAYFTGGAVRWCCDRLTC